MNVAFSDLSTEHEAFLQLLDRFDRNPRLLNETNLRALFHLLELHHAKEEELLFPLLFGSGALEVGGPKCMTFFTPRVLGAGWKDSFHELRERLGAPSPAPQGPFRSAVFAGNSMLKIPVEDHLAGAQAGEALLRLAKRGEDPSPLFAAFSAHLRDHIRREEECLLPMFRRSVNEERARDYARLAADRDALSGAAELRESLRDGLPG